MRFTSTVLLIVLVTSLVGAQRRNRGQSDKTKSPVEYDRAPFSTEREDLPVGYVGHSLIAIAERLNAQMASETRGEFEPTLEYNQRMAQLAQSGLVGTLRRDSFLAFAIPYQMELMRYDADLSTMDISLKWEKKWSFEREARLKYFSNSTVLRTYIGRNAFNRAVKVTVLRDMEYFLAADVENLGRIEGLIGGSELHFFVSLPMRPSDGVMAKITMRVLVIGKLAATKPVKSETNYQSPTIDSPYETYTYAKTLRIVPVEIWLYDFLSGRVYFKFRQRQPQLGMYKPFT